MNISRREVLRSSMFGAGAMDRRPMGQTEGRSKRSHHARSMRQVGMGLKEFENRIEKNLSSFYDGFYD